jgi:AcrR family transcriptional regulator
MTEQTMAAARRGRPGHSVESLLAVAVAVFNERGYEATSMDELALRAGITKSAIYHHVPGKEELLRLAVDRALDGLFAVTREPEATDGPAIDRLEHVVRGSIRVLTTELPFVTLLLRVRGNTKTERWAMERRREFDQCVSGLLKAAVAEGDLRGDVEVRLATRLLFGMINSIVEWYRPDVRGALDGEQVADAVVRLAFDGLRP